MAGANYMGGKRNAAKARSKDSAGRIQKDFFGRRRLDMLSKGLANKTKAMSPLSPTINAGAGISAISLAHARSAGEVEWFPLHSYIPGSTRVPSTPRSGRKNHASKVGSSSGSSRVLDALDTEPLFVRQTLNRILALPDLACLPGRQSRRSKRSAIREVADTIVEPARKKQKKSSLANRRSPPRLRDYTATSSQASPLYNSSDGLVTHVDSGEDLSDDHSDHGYQDFVAELDQLTHSPLHLTYFQTKGDEAWQNIRPPKPSCLEHSSSRTSPFLPHGRSQAISSLPPSSEQGSSDYRPQDSQQHLSSSLQVPETRSQDHDAFAFQTPPKPRLVFSSNNLYEHEDPWHTIGVILGLSPMSPKADGRRANPASSTFTNATHFTRDGVRTPNLHHDPENELPMRSHSVESNASFVALSYTNSSPTPAHCRTPSPATDLEEVQSPFRILLESKRMCASSPTQTNSPVPNTLLNLTEYDDSDTAFPTSPNSRRLSALARSRRASDAYEADEEVHSPYWRLLASKTGAVFNKNSISDLNLTLNLTGYDNSYAALSSPSSSRRLWKRTSRPSASIDSADSSDSTAFDDNGMANKVDHADRRSSWSPSVSARAFYQGLWKHIPSNADAESVSPGKLYTRPTTIANSAVAISSYKQSQNFMPSLLEFKKVDGVFQGPCLFPEDDDDLGIET